MDHLQTSRHGRVLVITMARGKANALNGALVDDLNRAMSRAEHDHETGAVVLASASAKVYSAGFDVNEVFSLSDTEMREFFTRFMALEGHVRQMSKPTVAAISGHAYAGGAILALACDFRVMAQGDFAFAINEVNLGIVLPTVWTRRMERTLGTAARQLLLAGQPLSPQRALQLGLADELTAPEAVLDRAIEMAVQLTEKPPRAFAAIKRALDEGQQEVSDRIASVDEFMDYWVGEECRSRRAALVQQLKRP